MGPLEKEDAGSRSRAAPVALTEPPALMRAMVFMRPVVLATILGAGVAAAAVYLLPQSVLQDRFAVILSAADRPEEPEEWPICTTMSSVADAADWAQLDPDFAAGKKGLAAGDWHAAIAALKLAALRDPRNADLQNYIGYAYRRLRQLEPAFAHYQLALTFNPRHRAAHEHMGEAYLAMGKFEEAEAHLAALRDVCLIPCDEYRDLERAIATYKSSATR
jgi:tetratricopeptide (TPR) repeat protein